MSSCPDPDVLAEWSHGQCSTRDAAAVALHVARCARCQRAHLAWRRLAVTLRAAAPTVAPPAYRPPTVVGPGPIAAVRPAIRPSAPAPWWRRRPMAWAWATAAAVAAVGVVTRTPAGRSTVGPAVVAAPTVVLRPPTVVARAARPGSTVRSAAPSTRRSPTHAVPEARPVADRPAHARAPGTGMLAGASVVPIPMPTPKSDGPTTGDGPSPAATDWAPMTATSPGPTTEPPPTPVPPPPTDPAPAIAGLVIGGDGHALAGARIEARPVGGGSPSAAITGPDGGFRLRAGVGRWLVHASAAGHSLAWFGGAPSPWTAEPLEVGPDGATADFGLEPAPPTRIRGRVADATGAPVAAALVVAFLPPDGAGPGVPVASTFAGDDGRYELPVGEGGWLVAATANGASDGLAWWGGDGSVATADRVPVAESGPNIEGIDVRLVGAAP